MFLNFDKVDVIVNNSGILATNATISTNNSIEGYYSIGYARSAGQLASGPTKSTFNATYIPVISQEPNYAIISKIRNMVIDSGYYGEKIELAGIVSENYFLTNYSISIQPNNIAESNVSYVNYWELCGSLKEKSNRIDYLNDGDIKHAWSTYILTSGSSITNPVYEFVYNFNADWQPIYTIGRKFPVEMKLLNISESISFNMDSYRNILFTGELVYNNLLNNNNGNLEFKNISLICEDNCEDVGASNGLLLNISGFKINSIDVGSQVGEMVRTKYSATRYK